MNLAVVSRWEESKNRNKLKPTKVKQSLFPLISDRHCHKAPCPFEFILYIKAILWLQLSIVTEGSAYFVLIEDRSSLCYTSVCLTLTMTEAGQAEQLGHSYGRCFIHIK